MEIERVVTGDLNKNIEQCVNLLMDVERKVHGLKNELAQTLGQARIAVPQAGAQAYGIQTPATASPVAYGQGFPALYGQGFQAYGHGLPSFYAQGIPSFPGYLAAPYGVPTLAPYPAFATPFGAVGAPVSQPWSWAPWTSYQSLARTTTPAIVPSMPSFGALGPVGSFGNLW